MNNTVLEPLRYHNQIIISLIITTLCFIKSQYSTICFPSWNPVFSLWNMVEYSDRLHSRHILISALLATYSTMISIQPTVVLDLFLDHCKPNLAICSNLLQEWSLVEWSHLVYHHWNSKNVCLKEEYQTINHFLIWSYTHNFALLTAIATFTLSVCSTFFSLSVCIVGILILEVNDFL